MGVCLSHRDIKKDRICVIGAGLSGLALLHAFERHSNKHIEIVCFEKSDRIGGLWSYKWKNAIDAHEEPHTRPTYNYFWSPSPKECFEFSDYTFADHFGDDIPIVLRREDICRYLEGRFQKSTLVRDIRFNTVVTSIDYDENRCQFLVFTKDMEKSETYQETFTRVIDASGHFSGPNIPLVKGIETFVGTVIHAYEFVPDTKILRGKNLLLVGHNYSAIDISSQCRQLGCLSLAVCDYYSKKTLNSQPCHANFEVKSYLKSISKNEVLFEDGTSKFIDIIIFCTRGSFNRIPLIQQSIEVADTGFYTGGIYKSIFTLHNSNLMYLGMLSQSYTFAIADIQAIYVREVILGHIKLPSKTAMLEDDLRWTNRAKSVNSFDLLTSFQTDYMHDLLTHIKSITYNFASIELGFKESRKDQICYSKTPVMQSFRSHNGTIIESTFLDPWLLSKEDLDEVSDLRSCC